MFHYYHVETFQIGIFYSIGFCPDVRHWGTSVFNFFGCRRERDNTEAERAQHVKQIHDFQEHFQEKERHLLELQEQVCEVACSTALVQ